MEMCNPCHPGEIIREEYLNPLNISITEAALKLGISRVMLSEIVNERAGISSSMALRLAKAFNTSAEYWTNLQSQYDLAHARKNTNLDDVQVLYG
jgi:antitoxin HigA-1